MLKPADLLSWNAELGYGFFPVDPGEWPYDEAYRAKYEAMAGTPMARRLNTHRVALAKHAAEKIVRLHKPPSFLDVGPGDGAFMGELIHDLPEGEDFVYGFDVNPAMITKLKAENRWGVPGLVMSNPSWMWDVITFWDSFEHIHRPDLAVRATRAVAMSIPIFKNRAHVLESKHFRPDEHVWYFTHEGIITFMKKCGFSCVYYCDTETRIGREDIKSYIFVRD